MRLLYLLKIVALLLGLVALSGCGYRPSALYARSVVGEKISTIVHISATDPENSVIVKDAVDAAVIEVFHASLVAKRDADTNLAISISAPSYTPLQYNSNGFIISYRATITLKISRESKDLKKSYSSKGTYDFAVLPNAVLSDQQRFEAIKFSSIKAIASFVSQVSAEGAKH